MGAEESVPDPLEWEFFGMKFICNEDGFKKQIREEFEVLFFIPYLITWWEVFIWATLGLFQ